MNKKLTLGLFALLFVTSGVQSLAISKIQKDKTTKTENVAITTFDSQQQAAIGLYDTDSPPPEPASAVWFWMYFNGGNDCSVDIYDGGTYLGSISGWNETGDDTVCYFSWAFPTPSVPSSNLTINYSKEGLSVTGSSISVGQFGLFFTGYIGSEDVTGKMNIQTQRALKNFQRNKNLAQSGEYDLQTQAVLEKIFSESKLISPKPMKFINSK